MFILDKWIPNYVKKMTKCYADKADNYSSQGLMNISLLSQFGRWTQCMTQKQRRWNQMLDRADRLGPGGCRELKGRGQCIVSDKRGAGLGGCIELLLVVVKWLQRAWVVVSDFREQMVQGQVDGSRGLWGWDQAEGPECWRLKGCGQVKSWRVRPGDKNTCMSCLHKLCQNSAHKLENL